MRWAEGERFLAPQETMRDDQFFAATALRCAFQPCVYYSFVFVWRVPGSKSCCLRVLGLYLPTRVCGGAASLVARQGCGSHLVWFTLGLFTSFSLSGASRALGTFPLQGMHRAIVCPIAPYHSKKNHTGASKAGEALLLIEMCSIGGSCFFWGAWGRGGSSKLYTGSEQP